MLLWGVRNLFYLAKWWAYPARIKKKLKIQATTTAGKVSYQREMRFMDRRAFLTSNIQSFTPATGETVAAPRLPGG